MATRADLDALIERLDSAGALDSSTANRTATSDLIRRSALADQPGIYVLGGDHYVLVCGATPLEAESVEEASDVVRSALQK
jgi:hypothetical protein